MTQAQSIISTVINAARSALTARQAYADDVLTGRQCWSGADLKGKARRYGGSYARGRTVARSALFRAGGLLIQCQHGRWESAVLVATDDFGNAVYATTRGFVRPVTRAGFCA